MIKEKNEKEMNYKKLALSCAKEVRRKCYKSQKVQKEHVLRAKKLHREMITYWRKKERELNEIKKKKQKLETELRKREDEEREVIMQKKRLEFLMTQSSFYSQYMAKKMGIDQDDQEKLEPQVEVDKEEAIQNVHDMIIQQKQDTLQYDNLTQTQDQALDTNQLKHMNNMDFSQNDQKLQQTIVEPQIFKGKLKEYQLKGLRWLDNLFDQGINGILADEMGLGKTIQAIALLSHVFENKNNYGPFLIVAPSSTLFNWQSEIAKFCPCMNVLPYWGTLEQRKTLRKFFQQKQMGKINSPFNVIITSYQLIVSDDKIFHRLKWQYMILDEAQAIKNVQSQRWKSLLTFNSRNRLLLTGTPIQNTMAELWALLHFIMPKLFDSHEQFQEWFSKDIEAHSQQQGQLNQQQLQRLHAILKPFMLRRIKKDVEHEIGQKTEYHIVCDMTKRQQMLYNTIKQKLSVQDFFSMMESKVKVENLMNLVMQFRKVCNHPELFERRPVRSPFYMKNPVPNVDNQAQPFNQIKELYPNTQNPISQILPKLVYDDLLFKVDSKTNLDIFNIHSTKHILWSLAQTNSIYSFLPFIGIPLNYFEYNQKKSPIHFSIIVLHFMQKLQRINKIYPNQLQRYKLWIAKEILQKSPKNDFIKFNTNTFNFYLPSVQSDPIQLKCSSQNLELNQRGQFYNHQNISILLSCKYQFDSSFLSKQYNFQDIQDRQIYENNSKLQLPSFDSLINDATKMRYLDKLLKKLKQEGHRVLIFCQMTKMIDLLEEYVIHQGYKYFRLDGSSNISDRRDMVVDFQTQDDIFCFLLSTRAGGLGVTLTAADTVIFYDNDWNPTMDAQATDRAHRLGQEKEVTVYRLVTKGTIEERIVKRAQQKQNVQSTVYSGGAFKADNFKASEVMELLFDENEIQQQEQLQSMLKNKKKNKKVKKSKKFKLDVQFQDSKSITSKQQDDTDQNENQNMDIDLDFTDALNKIDD